MGEMLKNRTFNELKVGDEASLSRTLTRADIAIWAALTGNVNPAHVDEAFAAEGIFKEVVGPGMWGASLFSALIGTRLPGPGTITLGGEMRFLKPLEIEKRVTATVRVESKKADGHVVVLDCRCVDDEGNLLITSTVEVVAPTVKYSAPMVDLPRIELRHHDRFQTLLDQCEQLEPISTVVVHPCSDDALEGALEAAEAGLIEPILVGPKRKIYDVAERIQADIGSYRLVDTEHSHAAAERAVALIRGGEAETLMKGSLHTDELLAEVVRKDTGLRTERWISHVFLISVPTFDRPIIITDAAINIDPGLEAKRDICQNAIDIARVVGIAKPKVAILSAVETVNPGIPSTLEAAALCKMADRGQITGGLLDGPLALDNAIDIQAAKTKGIVSPVAGRADILLVPDLEAGNILAKQLTFMGGADAAGLVVGARVPIILTSRADNVRTRLASCAVAVLVVHSRRMALTEEG